VISGTDFLIEEDFEILDAIFRGLRHPIARTFEIDDLKAQCEARTAMCLSCDDGTVVVTLQPFGEQLELFVLLAVALRHGAFQRQEAALRKIARDLGAQTIAFEARRSGWARRLGPQWKRRGTMEFVRCVDER